MSDVEEAVAEASFLRDIDNAGARRMSDVDVDVDKDSAAVATSAGDAAVESAAHPPSKQMEKQVEQADGDQEMEDPDGEDEDGDEDEPPKMVEQPAIRASTPSPFADAGQAPASAATANAAGTASSTAMNALGVHNSSDEYLRVSEQCCAKKCFRLQWEAEMNPRCRQKTTLNIDSELYAFDGFYVLCHDDPPDLPQFEYTRGGVMCRFQFVREDLPATLLPPSTDGRSTTSPEGCVGLFLLQRFLFQQMLNIQTPHLFQTTFADPSRATGDPRDICSDFHLIPRFISVTAQPLINKKDLDDPHRVGFAVGKLLPVQHILGCLDASAKHPVRWYLGHFAPESLIDAIVTMHSNNKAGAFRVDELVFQQDDEGNNDNYIEMTGASSRAKPTKRVVIQLKHKGEGAREFDGAAGRRKIRKWEEKGSGKLIQSSPCIDPCEELLDLDNAFITGLQSDVMEIASALPMVLKYVRHYRLLASFAADMKLTFTDTALLRQAFTHSSYVDTGMQHVNTVEATIGRVRLGHVFEHAHLLKRSRCAFLDDATQKAEMDPELRRIAEQHLTGSFQAEFHSKNLCSYERLEFLGDAVLSFMVASSAFLKLPKATEGMLHETRKDVACNATLGRIARAANFESLMLTAFDVRTVKDEVLTKIAADCLEALLGAVYLDQDIVTCRRLWGELLTRHDPDLKDLYYLSDDQVEKEADAYIEIDRERFQAWSQQRETRMRHRHFTTTAQVSIRNTHLWLQCMTHGSFQAPQIDADAFVCHDPSYERIEFLGDAVLQILSSAFLVAQFPNHQEHLLTQARSSLVKNTRLAVVARRAGYEEHIRLGKLVQKSGMLYTEDVLADTFEATLGAVYLEHVHDLGQVNAILERALFPLLQEAIARREWMSPRDVFAHHMELSSRGRERAAVCCFKKLPSRTDNEHCVALFVDNTMLTRASGRTINAAKDAACRRALRMLNVPMKTSDPVGKAQSPSS